MNLTRASLKRPVTAFMIFACLVVIGIIASWMLPLEFFPDMDFPFVHVEFPYPGSTPEEIERRITQPAEEVLATIGGIKRMSSNSWENGAWVEMQFEWGSDANVKALEIREKLDGIRHLLPDDFERVFVYKWSASDMEMLQVRISSNRDLANSYDMLNRNLKRRIERIPGVSKVELYGVEQKEIRIRLSADRIIAHRVDIGSLVAELERSNFLVTAGKVTDGDRRLVVRPVGEFTTIDEIGDIVVGEGTHLRDIAEITYGHPKLDYGRHLDRRYAVGLEVFKEGGANTVEVSERVVREIEEVGKLPEMEGIRIFYLNNQAEAIVSSLDELLKSGALGGLLALIILFFFLRQLATTFIVAIAVPFSILIAMAFMYFFGMSLNILSMMGLMLAVGMLVDNAVVATESIHRHQLVNSKSVKSSIITGVSEISLAITAGTLTTAIVFLPNIVSPNNQTSIYLKHVAISLVIALGASLVLAQTIVPLLVSRVKPPRRDRKSNVIDRLIGRYRRTIDWSLRHRWPTVAVIFILFASIAVPAMMVKTDMFDEPSDRRLRLHYHIDGSYTVEKVEAAVNVYEDYLFANKDEFEIESVYTYYQSNYASSTITLKKGKDASKSMDEIRDAIREGLPKLAIANPSFEWRSTAGEGQSVRVQIMGKSSAQLVAISRDVAWVLSQVEGLTDARSEAETGDEEVHVVVDRDRAQQLGFSSREVANVVSAAMRGITLRPFQSEDGEIPVRLEFQDDDKRTLEDLRNLPLFDGENQPVSLASVADFTVRRGPQNIRRENRATSLGVTANLDGITMGEAKERIGRVLGNFNFPAGYTWNYGERFDEEQEVLRTMLFNLALALALIYFVMAALFESFLFPSAIWTQILFAVVGVYWFFLITGTTMTLMALIGILILIGVVVNNGIVLIDCVNQLRARGVGRHEALVEAGAARLRPILMTAGTTILSLVPLCIVKTQIGGDGPPYFPMARAIVGGLAFSTLVTLLVLPTIYCILDDLRLWAGRVVSTARTART